jgi:hypothetical protein
MPPVSHRGNGAGPSSLIADPEVKAPVQKLWLDWTDEGDAPTSSTRALAARNNVAN